MAVKEGITGPLGMDQTTFLMTDEQRPNCTLVHVKGEDGSWVSIGEVLSQAPGYWAGGHGRYGPPSDYITFERALLRGGELDGTRILQPSTVDAAWSGSWAGLGSTRFWVDRTAGVCASIYSNFLPFVTPEALWLYGDFERPLYAAR